MSNLFLVCSECDIENNVLNKFGRDSFFIHSLGGIFDTQHLDLMASIELLISTENIDSINIVVNSSCTFINDALPLPGKPLSPINIIHRPADETLDNPSVDQQQKKDHLAAITASAQLHKLLDWVSEYNNRQSKNINAYSMIYSKDEDQFQKAQLQVN